MRREQIPWPCFFKEKPQQRPYLTKYHRQTATTETDDTPTPTITATKPYREGMSENTSRILQPLNIRFVHEPNTSLPTNVKDKHELINRKRAIYKIQCFCIVETGRNLTTRLTEHNRAARKGDVNNHITEHHRVHHPPSSCLQGGFYQ